MSSAVLFVAVFLLGHGRASLPHDGDRILLGIDDDHRGPAVVRGSGRRIQPALDVLQPRPELRALRRSKLDIARTKVHVVEQTQEVAGSFSVALRAFRRGEADAGERTDRDISLMSILLGIIAGAIAASATPLITWSKCFFCT